MKDETRTWAVDVIARLESLLEAAREETFTILETATPIELAIHFHGLREVQREISDVAHDLKLHVADISEHQLPTMFTNHSLSSLRLDDIGTVAVKTKWHASMRDPAKCMRWLSYHGAKSLIIKTVNSRSLTSHAQETARAGKPLPDELFSLSSSNYTSITQG